MVDKLRSKLESTVRTGLNGLTDAVADFEARGGLRGAANRARARTERAAQRLRELLAERGIQIDLPGSDGDPALRRAYRILEVEPSVDFETVKHAYRSKMREHHPDRHAGDVEREKKATRIAQELTAAYELIEAHHKELGH